MDRSKIILYFEIFEKTEVKKKKVKKTLENFVSFANEFNLITCSLSLFENLVKNYLLEKLDTSDECPDCKGSGLNSYLPYYELCETCYGQGAIASRKLTH